MNFVRVMPFFIDSLLKNYPSKTCVLDLDLSFYLNFFLFHYEYNVFAKRSVKVKYITRRHAINIHAVGLDIF